MSEIKRFSIDGNNAMIEDEEGSFVKFEALHIVKEKSYIEGRDMAKRLLRIQLGLAVESD